MPKDSKKVLVGAPDYGTTGAILTGDVMTNIPATLAEALTAVEGFVGVGYVSEDGLSLSTDVGTETVKDWSRVSVRTFLNDFTGKASWVMLQAGYEEWCLLLGDDNVTRSGDEIHVKVGPHLPPRRCFAAKMKDGDTAMLVLIPNGQVTSGLDITFQAGDVIRLPIEVDCLDDGTGETIHFYSATTVTGTTDTGTDNGTDTGGTTGTEGGE